LKPLPRVYFLGAVLAIGLGIYVVARQIAVPLPPATSGCIEAEFDSAGAHRPRWARIRLQACPHFDAAAITLWVDAPVDSAELGGLILSGSGPADPRRWPQYLRAHWLNQDSLLIEHSADLRFLERQNVVGRIRILYREFAS
jgi:hypothetical protein